MTIIDTAARRRRGERGKLWLAMAAGALLWGPTFPGSTAQAAADASVAAPAKKKKPTIEQLELRIELLEQKLEAQQQATLAAQQAAAAAQSAALAAQQSVSSTQPAPLVATAPAAVSPAQSTRSPVGSQPPAAGAAQRASNQQPVTEQEAATVITSNPQIFAGPGGFSFQSVDGANQIRFHGEFDFDGRFYNDDLTPDQSRSTWLLRRARPIIEGTFANIFDFRFNPDFAGGKTVIQDAFVAARFNPLFVVTAGKFKEPFGLERLQLSPNNRFIELGLPSDLVPNRDLGIQVSGTYGFKTGTLIYQVGWFNGVADGTSTDANVSPDVDNNDDKDWVARVFAQPFSKTDIAALKGLGAGIAVSYVNQVGTSTNTLLASYKTETQRNFFSFDQTRLAVGAVPAASATYADGERLRVSPQAYYYYQSLGLLTEYVHESQDVARTVGAGAGSFTHRGTVKPESWQFMATYSLTGDTATFGTVSPKRPFVIGQPGWGAIDVAARISELSLGSTAFANASNGAVSSWFADPSVQPSKALAWTLGLNWYLNQNVVWFVDFTKTRFDGGALNGTDRDSESAFFTRFQVAF